MANLALTAYIRREHPDDYSIWRHGVCRGSGRWPCCRCFFITVWPIPAWPFNLTPYFFIAALIVGFCYMQWRESRNPGSLARGATMLVGRVSDAEGDVDWSTPDGRTLRRAGLRGAAPAGA